MASTCTSMLTTASSVLQSAVWRLRSASCLYDVNAWLSRSRLRLNASKTHVIWLGSSQLLDKIDICVVPVILARVTVSDTVRDLGIFLDGRLTMADHVVAVCCSCYYQLRQLHSVARSLSAEAVKAVVHAFISSRLDYCNSLMTGVNEGLLWRLQTMQNATARLVQVPDDVNTSLRHCGSCTGYLFDNESSIS